MRPLFVRLVGQLSLVIWSPAVVAAGEPQRDTVTTVTARPERFTELSSAGVYRLQLGPRALFIRGEYDILRVDKRTRERTYLARTSERACATAVHDGYLYWTEIGPTLGRRRGKIRRLRLPKAMPEDVVGGLRAPGALAVDVRGLFAIDNRLQQLVTARRGRPRRLARSGGGWSHLLLCTRRVALDATHAYYVFAGSGPPTAGNDRVMRIQRRGGRPQPLAKDLRHPRNLVLDERHVYWATERVGGRAAIQRVLKAGGSVETLATLGRDPGRLRLQGSLLYFIEAPHQAGYAIRSVPKRGGPVALLHRGVLSAGSLVVDQSHLYWTDYGHPKGTCHRRQRFGRHAPETHCTGPYLRVLRLRLPGV